MCVCHQTVLKNAAIITMCINAVIEEQGVRLKLTVTDTPGFGDKINNDKWQVKIALTCVHIHITWILYVSTLAGSPSWSM